MTGLEIPQQAESPALSPASQIFSFIQRLISPIASYADAQPSLLHPWTWEITTPALSCPGSMSSAGVLTSRASWAPGTRQISSARRVLIWDQASAVELGQSRQLKSAGWLHVKLGRVVGMGAFPVQA
jgi:hypothetical protein